MSCNSKQEDKNKHFKKLDENPKIDILKRRMLLNGGDSPYAQFRNYCDQNIDSVSTRDFLIYSTILADKNYHGSAYFNSFEYSIRYFAKKNDYKIEYFKELNTIQKEFALSYLNKGSRKEWTSCTSILIKIYRDGIGVEKNIKKSDSLMQFAKSIDSSFRVSE